MYDLESAISLNLVLVAWHACVSVHDACNGVVNSKTDLQESNLCVYAILHTQVSCNFAKQPELREK